VWAKPLICHGSTRRCAFRATAERVAGRKPARGAQDLTETPGRPPSRLRTSALNETVPAGSDSTAGPWRGGDRLWQQRQWPCGMGRGAPPARRRVAVWVRRALRASGVPKNAVKCNMAGRRYAWCRKLFCRPFQARAWPHERGRDEKSVCVFGVVLVQPGPGRL
jgi:hypothetical protein